jgi:coenzyme F420-dependent glucose-6-phosphate dehydrogenase
MLERFHPAELAELAVDAEQAGFDGVMADDHFQPWTPHQGQAGFVWNVMTAMAERTRGPVGVGATCPSFRWHPAVVAQALRRHLELVHVLNERRGCVRHGYLQN